MIRGRDETTKDDGIYAGGQEWLELLDRGGELRIRSGDQRLGLPDQCSERA